MTDWVTPGFKRSMLKGGIHNSPMTRVKTTLSTTTSGPAARNMISIYPNVQFAQHDGPHWTTGPLKSINLPGSRPTPPDDIATLRALTATRAIANIDQPDFEGLVTLGEMKETLRYLRNPVAAGLKLADTIASKSRKVGLTKAIANKRKKDAQRQSLMKDLASIHLSVIFGFKPLVKEITGALENLRPRAVPRPIRRTSRARDEKLYTDTWSTTESSAIYSYTATYVYKRTTVVRAGILYEYGCDTVDENTWGLRPKDILPAAYAVAPLSFVLDYFVNLGTFIGALVPSAGTRTLASWMTIQVTETLTRTVSGYQVVSGTPGWEITRQGSGQDIIQRVTFERQPWVDAPSLAFKDLTDLKNDVSKLSGMLSILTSRLLGSKEHLTSVVKQAKVGKILPPSAWSRL